MTFVLSFVVNLGSDIFLGSLAAKALFLVTGAFCMVVFAFFNADLTAHMLVQKPAEPVRSFDMAIAQGKKFLVWKNGAVENYLRLESNIFNYYFALKCYFDEAFSGLLLLDLAHTELSTNIL